MAVGALAGGLVGLLAGLLALDAFPSSSLALGVLGVSLGGFFGGMLSLLRARNERYRARAMRGRSMTLGEQLVAPADAGRTWRSRRSRRGGRRRDGGRAPRGPS